MLACVEKVVFVSVTDQSGSPLDLQEKVEVRFEEVDDSDDLGLFQSCSKRCTSAQYVSFLDDQLEKFGEAGEKSVVQDDCFVVSEVTARV